MGGVHKEEAGTPLMPKTLLLLSSVKTVKETWVPQTETDCTTLFEETGAVVLEGMEGEDRSFSFPHFSSLQIILCNLSQGFFLDLDSHVTERGNWDKDPVLFIYFFKPVFQ